jgi:hypothetical protein
MGEDILEKGRLSAEEAGPGLKGRKNAYECDGEGVRGSGAGGCGAFIVTVDRDTGVTPFMLRCGRCGEPAHSKFYRVQDYLEPTHEWYRPDSLDGVDYRVFDHLEHGGLIIRPIDGKPDEWQQPEQCKQVETRIALASDLLRARMLDAEARVRALRQSENLEELRKAPISRQARRHAERKARRS